MSYLRTSAEISLSAIRHNADQIRNKLEAGTRLCAVVKANAYGHGAVAVATALRERADWFAVATAEEGEELRGGGITQPILVLGYTSPGQYALLFENELTPTIYREEDARALSEEAYQRGRRLPIHIAVDTGMGRIGFRADETDSILRVTRLPGLKAEGIFSHLAGADMKNKDHAKKQIECFRRVLSELEEAGARFPIRHLANSAAITELPEAQFDMVRAGIILYGIYPSEEVDKTAIDLRPALAWHARVIHVKEVGPGTTISYGATFVTEKESTRVATISVGYADGYPRALSSVGRVLIRGKAAPVLGRVCMDQFMVDVSDIPETRIEDAVTLIGTDGELAIPVEEVADPAGRFNYEMLCDISARVPRLYRDV